MSLIEQEVLNLVQLYPHNKLIIAYSGGIDSQVLLHTISQLKKQNKLNQTIVACHVNHGLSEYANEWQQFAVESCKSMNIELVAKQITLDLAKTRNIEAKARDARYQALFSCSAGELAVITGHHLDDQAETFLLAAKRGAGLKGLSAMQKQAVRGEGVLLRPLLNISRQQIEEYAQVNKLSWIDDDSNQDQNFDRNFLRHQVIPELAQRWPHFTKAIARSAEHCQQGQELLDELAQQDYLTCQVSELSLSVSDLSQLSEARLNNLLRYFLTLHNLNMPSQHQLMQVRKQLSAQQDKSPEVKVANHWLRRYQNQLYLTPDYQNINDWQQSFIIDVKGKVSGFIELPDQLGTLNWCIKPWSEVQTNQQASTNTYKTLFLAVQEGQQLKFCFNHNNPSCLPDFRQHSRSLKKVLQELQLAPWQRKRLPFIYLEQNFVGVSGYFIDKAYLPNQKYQTLQLDWLTEMENSI